MPLSGGKAHMLRSPECSGRGERLALTLTEQSGSYEALRGPWRRTPARMDVTLRPIDGHQNHIHGLSREAAPG